jgi:hypothetical protein
MNTRFRRRTPVMNPNVTRERSLGEQRDLPPSHVVALIGSHRSVVWPPLCPACGAVATTRIDVAKIFGRYSQYGNRTYYRSIVRMSIPYCQGCAQRHRQLVTPVPSLVGSLFRTPAILALIGAIAVATILWMIFIQGGSDASEGSRLYAFSGIVLLVAFGFYVTAREARFLRVPPLTEVTSACDFSDNVGYPLGRRRFYAIRHPSFAEAFIRANDDRLWTEGIRKWDDRIAAIVVGLLALAALIGLIVRALA